ncbi:hypothetical protein MESS4_750120 [Mesorhizobium sp. STM 4661]|nr:hypothetical protein MESS4_750120 [Mesorhizobium sp. STM 4661]
MQSPPGKIAPDTRTLDARRRDLEIRPTDGRPYSLVATPADHAKPRRGTARRSWNDEQCRPSGRFALQRLRHAMDAVAGFGDLAHVDRRHFAGGGE